MKIVALDGHTLNPGDNPWDPVAALGDFSVYDKTPDELVLERAAGAQVLLTNKVPLTPAVFDALPDLQFVSVTATGYNVVDTEAARRGTSRCLIFQCMAPTRWRNTRWRCCWSCATTSAITITQCIRAAGRIRAIGRFGRRR